MEFEGCNHNKKLNYINYGDLDYSGFSVANPILVGTNNMHMFACWNYGMIWCGSKTELTDEGDVSIDGLEIITWKKLCNNIKFRSHKLADKM